MTRKDPVTVDMALRVQSRDLVYATNRLLADGATRLDVHQWYWTHPLCLAPLLDPLGSGLCSGRTTLDHVKDQPKVGDPIQKRGTDRKRRYRAPSDERHLVSLCERHHLETGWATSHRPLLRDYLNEVNK